LCLCTYRTFLPDLTVTVFYTILPCVHLPRPYRAFRSITFPDSLRFDYTYRYHDRDTVVTVTGRLPFGAISDTPPPPPCTHPCLFTILPFHIYRYRYYTHSLLLSLPFHFTTISTYRCSCCGDTYLTHSITVLHFPFCCSDSCVPAFYFLHHVYRSVTLFIVPTHFEHFAPPDAGLTPFYRILPVPARY